MTIHAIHSEESAVFWQIVEDVETEEAAVLLKRYADVIELRQNGSEIIFNANRKNINELIKALKLIAKNIED